MCVCDYVRRFICARLFVYIHAPEPACMHITLAQLYYAMEGTEVRDSVCKVLGFAQQL